MFCMKFYELAKRRMAQRARLLALGERIRRGCRRGNDSVGGKVEARLTGSRNQPPNLSNQAAQTAWGSLMMGLHP